MTALDDLRASQDRDLRRVGIPMILALVDETGGAAAEPAASVADDGARLAASLDAARAELAPGQPDADNGIVVSLLTLVASLDRDHAT